MPSTGGGNSGSGGFSSGGSPVNSGFSPDTGGSFIPPNNTPNLNNNNHNHSFNRNTRGSGFSPIAAIVIVIAVFLFGAGRMVFQVNDFNEPHYQNGYSYIDVSEVVSVTALKPVYVNEIDAYLTDEAGVMTEGEASKVAASLENFYAQTGVQPYLYITDEFGEDEAHDGEIADDWLYTKYDELFTDEGHLLIMYSIYNQAQDYVTWYCVGDDAQTVTDHGDCQMILDMIDEYHYSSAGYPEMFDAVFTYAAELIMKPEVVYDQIPVIVTDNVVYPGEQTNSFAKISFIVILVGFIIVIVLASYFVIRAKKKGGVKVKPERKQSSSEDPWDNVDRRNDDPWDR